MNRSVYLTALHSFTPPLSRRSASIPNRQGTKALYEVNTQTPGSPANITETRILDLSRRTSTLFSNDPRDKEATWLGVGDLVIWLKAVDCNTTEMWIADADDAGQNTVHLQSLPSQTLVGVQYLQPAGSYCAGSISARATYLKLQRLHNEYGDIAIAVSCPTTSNGGLYNTATGASSRGVANAIWFTNLRKKAMDNSTSNIKYILSPSKFVNALQGTGLESPLRAPDGSSADFDISTSGIVFLAKEFAIHLDPPAHVNVYYIRLKTFTRVPRHPPQVVNVKGFEGRSFSPVFSPDGNSVAFLKKKISRDQNDRNRVIVVNNIRDFGSHTATDDMPTRECEQDWHLSPYSVAWSENGKELYVVAIDAGIRRLFKIPATLSTIRKAPEPITTNSTTPADVRHLRMIFSAPMDLSTVG